VIPGTQPVPNPGTEAMPVQMDPAELHARATIAAALIMARAVEVPTIPTRGDWSKDSAALRLRDLTDYIYQMITSPSPR
jgi:hypothetical protein